MSLFELCRQRTPRLGVLLWPIYQMTQKVARFEWNPEQERALSQVQAAVQAALPLEPHDPEAPMMPEIQVTDVAALWGLWQLL